MSACQWLSYCTVDFGHTTGAQLAFFVATPSQAFTTTIAHLSSTGIEPQYSFSAKYEVLQLLRWQRLTISLAHKRTAQRLNRVEDDNVAGSGSWRLPLTISLVRAPIPAIYLLQSR